MMDELSVMLRRWTASLLTAACLLACVAVTWHFVGSSNLVPREQRSVTAIGTGDYSLQFYYATLGSRLLAQSGVPYGYDPAFLSGYVKSPTYFPSSLPFELSLYVLSDFAPGLVFNWTVFVLLALCPFLLYAAAVNFGLQPYERLVLVALLLLPPEALEPRLALYAIMQAAGMVSFVFASFLSVYTVSLVYRFIVGQSWGAAVPLLLVAPASFLVHPTAPLFTVPPLAYLYVTQFRTITPGRHAALWGVALATAAALIPWTEAFLLFQHYSNLEPFHDDEAKLHFSAAGGSLLGPLASFLGSGGWLARLPMVLGVAGVVLWRQGGAGVLARFFAFQILTLTAVVYYGDRLGLSAISPGRLVLPLGLYLFVPAAVSAVALVRSIRKEFPLRLRARPRCLAAAALALLLPDLLHSAVPPSALERATLPGLQMESGYSGTAGEFASWLEGNTDTSGRILHEETSRFSYQYYGAYLAALLPLRMNREFAGGPAPFPLVQQNVLRFMAGRLQERPIGDVDPAALESLLQLYNVRWVLCWSDESKAYFGGHLAHVTPVASFEKFELYRVDRDASYFLKGSGQVESAPNVIFVKDAVAENDDIVLRYHFDANLKVPRPMELFPYEVPGDPVPFLGVRRPASSFSITFDYRTGERPPGH